MYKQDGMYSQPQLGDFFDDLTKFAGKVGDVAGKVKRIGGEVGDVASGKKQVYTAPAGSGSVFVPVPGKPYGVALPLLPILLGGGALLAVYLLSRGRR